MSKVINIGGRLHSTEQGNVLTGANEILDDTKGKKQNVINSETDAELLRLEQSKQNVLTFDNAPTENSNNPVKSGGVYAADKALSDAIEAILLLIPSAASALNQLADKAFVNSSVSTATATFRGTYNVVTDLELAYDATHEQIAAKLGQIIATADNNDYSFVQIPVSATSTNIRRTERYKFNGTAWGFEYDLNTSGFTAAQWEAINSGITALLVAKLSDLPTAEALATMFAAKQDTLTFDSEPTALSTNPVTSGGIYTAMQAVVTALTDYENSINALIPSEATDLNQLADKAYVLAKILDATPAFKGQFVTLAELQAVASQKAGDLGIVRTKDNDGLDVFTFYQYLNNTWNVFFTLQHHPLTKPATTGSTGDYPYNGMGRVELAMNIVNDVNTLTQAMLTQQDTIYVIQYDFTLGEDITVPANCVLEFDGGSLSNGTIVGQNTVVINESDSTIFTNVIVTGLNISNIPLTWCGGVPDFDVDTFNGTDNSAALYYALELASKNKNIPVYINGEFLCKSQINTEYPINLVGNYQPDQNPKDKGFSSRIAVLGGITLFNIIPYSDNNIEPSWWGFRIYNVAFCGEDKTSTLIDATNIEYEAPARPLIIESCHITRFRTVFIANKNVGHTFVVSKNIIISNIEVLVNENQGFGNIDIRDNIIEQNGDINNPSFNAVIYINKFRGAINISNNLLEGQPHAIKIISENGSSINITRNDFERNNSGDGWCIYLEHTGGGGAQGQGYADWNVSGNWIDSYSNIILKAASNTVDVHLGAEELRMLKQNSVNIFNIDFLRNNSFVYNSVLEDGVYESRMPILQRANDYLKPVSTRDEFDVYDGLYNYNHFVASSSSGTVFYTFDNLNIQEGTLLTFVFSCFSMQTSGSRMLSLIATYNDDSTEALGPGYYASTKNCINIIKRTATKTIKKIEVNVYGDIYATPVGVYLGAKVLNYLSIPQIGDFFSNIPEKRYKEIIFPQCVNDYIKPTRIYSADCLNIINGVYNFNKLYTGLSAGFVMYDFQNLTIQAGSVITLLFAHYSLQAQGVRRFLINATYNDDTVENLGIGRYSSKTIETCVIKKTTTKGIKKIEIKVYGEVYMTPVGIYIGDISVDKLSIPVIEDYFENYFPKSGNTAGMPISQIDGYYFFNTELGKPVFKSSSKWIDADGAEFGVKRSGTTADRPAGNSIYVGFVYFDTSLSPARPIYASAIAASSPYTVTWVDATGTPV